MTENLHRLTNSRINPQDRIPSEGLKLGERGTTASHRLFLYDTILPRRYVGSGSTKDGRATKLADLEPAAWLPWQRSWYQLHLQRHRFQNAESLHNRCSPSNVRFRQKEQEKKKRPLQVFAQIVNLMTSHSPNRPAARTQYWCNTSTILDESSGRKNTLHSRKAKRGVTVLVLAVMLASTNKAKIILKTMNSIFNPWRNLFYVTCIDTLKLINFFCKGQIKKQLIQ